MHEEVLVAGRQLLVSQSVRAMKVEMITDWRTVSSKCQRSDNVVVVSE